LYGKAVYVKCWLARGIKDELSAAAAVVAAAGAAEVAAAAEVTGATLPEDWATAELTASAANERIESIDW
jgi:hypothetical protein